MVKNDSNLRVSVSVIIPIYNSEKYLERCLNSVLSQNFSDWECICVNDGSVDGSQIVLDEYKIRDSRIKVIYQDNLGVSSARNKALENSNGDYIVFLDSDDYIDSDYLEILFEKIVKENSDICFCGYRSNEGKKIIKQHDYPIDKQRKDYYLNHLFSGTGGTVCSKIYSKELLKVNKIMFNTGFSLCEDQLFALEAICNAKKISSVDYYGYYYDRGNGVSITGQIDCSLWMTQLDLLEYMDSYLIDHNIDEMLKNELLEIKFKNVLYGIFSSMNPITREKWKNIISNNTVKIYLKQVHIRDKYDFAYLFPVKIKSYVLAKLIYFLKRFIRGVK